MNRGQPVLGYASKTDAVIALHLEGLKPIDIARRIGSSNKSVCQLLSYARRDGKLPGKPDEWPRDRVEKAHRLFGKTMLYIAEALDVPPSDLFRKGLRGVLPTLGRAPSIEPLLRQMAGEVEAADIPAVEPDSDERARDEAELAALEAEEEDADAPAEPVEEETPSPAPVDDAARKLQVFKLKSESGEFLHLHERGMTRLAQFMWRGSAEEVRKLKKRRPQFRDLDEVAC